MNNQELSLKSPIVNKYNGNANEGKRLFGADVAQRKSISPASARLESGGH